MKRTKRYIPRCKYTEEELTLAAIHDLVTEIDCCRRWNQTSKKWKAHIIYCLECIEKLLTGESVQQVYNLSTLISRL